MDEQRQAEGELGDGELFHLLVQNVVDYAIFVVDAGGLVRSWSGGAERLLGYTEGEALGGSADRFYTPEDVRDHVPQRERREALATGRGEDDRWHVRKDGTRFWAGGVMTPLRDEGGKLRGFAKIMRDRTEWWHAQQARREGEERTRLLLDSTGEAIYGIDTEGRCTFCNPACLRLLGHDRPEDLLGRNMHELIHHHRPDGTPYPERDCRIYRAYLPGEGTHADDEVLWRADGTAFPAEYRSYPVRSGGEVVGSVVTFTDITERKRAEATIGEQVRLAEYGRDVGRALTQVGTLEEVLARCAGATVRHLDGAFARIWTVDEAGGVLELRASAGMYTHTDGPHARIPVGQFKIGLIAQERRPHLTNAVIGDPRIPAQDWARAEGMVAFAGYPLVVEGRLVGVLAMFARNELSDAALRMIASVADEIAVGIARKQAEDRSREQQEWLSTTLASIGDAVIATDGTGRVRFMNAVAEALTGWPQGEAAGRPMEEVFRILNEETRRPAEHPVARVLRDGVAVGLANHTVLVARCGTETAIEDSAAPIRDACGHVVGVVMVFQDATERRRHEAALRGSERRHRAILESITDAFFAVDGGWRFTYVNGRAETLLGRGRDELIGRGLWEEYPGLAGSEFERAYRRAVDGQVAVTVTSYYPDHDRWYEVHCYPAQDGLSVYFRDVTERVRDEERLRRSELELADFFDNATVGLHWVGPDGTILRANRAELGMLGYERHEYVGRHIAEFHADEAAIGEILRRLQAGEALQDCPARLRCKDGTVKDVLIDSSVMREGGEFVHTRCFTRDVTGRKRAEDGLREQTRIAEALHRIGVLMAAELDLGRLVQVVTDEATRLTDARFGAFFYNVPDEEGGSYTLYTISGVPREAFSKFPMPRATDLFGPTFRNEGVVRLDDVTQDPRFGNNAPHHGMPEGHLPVRSYLAVPVASRTGEVLGGLFFGHPEPGVFAEADERLVVGIAAQAAVAIDNARLYRDLKESERRFRHLADAMPQLVWVTRPDRSVEYVNRRWLDYTGQTQGECLGPAGWAAVIHPEDLGRVADASVRAHAEKEPFEAEYRIRDASGAYRWHLGRSVPVFDESGSFVRRFGAATDIDDRKRAERDAHFLAEASAGLASIVDEASTLQRVAGLAVPHFADWCSVDLSDEGGGLRRLAVAHIDPEKVGLAQDLHRRYPPAPDAPYGVPHVIRTGSPEMVAEIDDDMIVAGARDEEHLRILRELGLKSYMCVPLRGRAGTLGAISFVAAESGRRYGPQDLLLAEDLAARAAVAVENSRLYAELKEADRRKNDFLATLAHELRNPLAPIRNALQLMKGPGGGEGFEAERAMAERNVVHLARLIDDLMDVARIGRGKIELQKEVVDLATIVRQAVETARPLIDDRRHRLDVAVPEGAIRLDADPTRLEQVFWNLLNNSAKYTGPGGQIRLSAEREGGEVVVRVRDTGIGMRAEMLPKVFDMFVQVGEHRDHAQGGLGIGLSLVRTLVEMHGGSISAHSDGPGRGSEFVVRLPVLSRTQGVEAPQRERPGSPAGETPRRRILVVDDNVDAARSLARLLTRVYGQEVRVAHDGPEALAVAEDFGPEVVLLDIGLPGMDGNEVARRLRERPEHGQTLIVALTGWGQEADVARSREAGFDHHLVKPANPDAILGLLTESGRGEEANFRTTPGQRSPYNPPGTRVGSGGA